MRTQTELQRRVAEVVRDRYEGRARKASLAVGHNENLIGQILSNPNHVPSLPTLRALADAFGWRLYDAVCWALDMEAQTAALEPLPEAEARRGLSRMGLDARHIDGLLQLARGLAPPQEPGPSRPAKNGK